MIWLASKLGDESLYIVCTKQPLGWRLIQLEIPMGSEKKSFLYITASNHPIFVVHTFDPEPQCLINLHKHSWTLICYLLLVVLYIIFAYICRVLRLAALSLWITRQVMRLPRARRAFLSAATAGSKTKNISPWQLSNFQICKGYPKMQDFTVKCWKTEKIHRLSQVHHDILTISH